MSAGEGGLPAYPDAPNLYDTYRPESAPSASSTTPCPSGKAVHAVSEISSYFAKASNDILCGRKEVSDALRDLIEDSTVGWMIDLPVNISARTPFGIGVSTVLAAFSLYILFVFSGYLKRRSLPAFQLLCCGCSFLIQAAVLLGGQNSQINVPASGVMKREEPPQMQAAYQIEHRSHSLENTLMSQDLEHGVIGDVAAQWDAHMPQYPSAPELSLSEPDSEYQDLLLRSSYHNASRSCLPSGQGGVNRQLFQPHAAHAGFTAVQINREPETDNVEDYDEEGEDRILSVPSRDGTASLQSGVGDLQGDEDLQGGVGSEDDAANVTAATVEEHPVTVAPAPSLAASLYNLVTSPFRSGQETAAPPAAASAAAAAATAATAAALTPSPITATAASASTSSTEGESNRPPEPVDNRRMTSVVMGYMFSPPNGRSHYPPVQRSPPSRIPLPYPPRPSTPRLETPIRSSRPHRSNTSDTSRPNHYRAMAGLNPIRGTSSPAKK